MADEEEEVIPEGVLVYPKPCSSIRKGDYVILKGRPCKCIELSYARCRPPKIIATFITAVDIFTNEKIEEMRQGDGQIDVPVVSSQEYILMDIVDGYCSLMHQETFEVNNFVELPKGEMGRRIKEALETEKDKDIMVTVLSACNEEGVVDIKIGLE